MNDVVEAHRILHGLASRLGELSQELDETSKALEPVERAYQNFIDAYELTLYRKAEEDSSKVPSADLRLKMALEDFGKREPETLTAYYELSARQKRLQGRCDRVSKQMSGWQSVARYEREMMEAG